MDHDNIVSLRPSTSGSCSPWALPGVAFAVSGWRLSRVEGSVLLSGYAACVLVIFM